jgi:hypothetical protein
MQLFLSGRVGALAAAGAIWLIGAGGIASAQSQASGQEQASPEAVKQAAAATAKGQTAGEFFKNVTTSTLKGLTPSDFLGAMGVMTAAVGYDCSNCHPGAGTDLMDWVSDAVPQKRTARKMVEMVANINKQNFGGAQMVTCWTCHHQSDTPSTSITLDRLYSVPIEERPDVVLPGVNQPPASQILDEYIQAMGGAEKLAELKSFVATGQSIGFAGLGGNANFRIFAEAPDRRGMWINFPEHPDRGISAWTYDGKTGWISAPRGYLGEYELTGNDLAGAKLDAVVSFPGQIKSAFPKWRVGLDDTVGDRVVDVVQGSDPSGLLGTFFFDKETHLLLRYVRQTPSPVGRISIQQDFEDYRDVDGIKFPFKYSFLWLDGRFTATLSDVKVNATVEESKFAKP